MVSQPGLVSPSPFLMGFWMKSSLLSIDRIRFGLHFTDLFVRIRKMVFDFG
jgi:hypothetical protein